MTAQEIFEAIRSATGITQEQITGRSRKKELVYAHMLFVYYLNHSVLKSRIKRKNIIIGRLIGRDRNTVRHIADKAIIELKYNKVYKRQFDAVNECLMQESDSG